MKKAMQIVVAVVFAAMQWCAQAKTNHVYSTNQEVGGAVMTPAQQLVYAVTNAAAGDVVLMHSGTYTFTGGEYSEIDSSSITNLLKVSAQNVSIVGDTGLSRKDWTDGAEPVIIDVNSKGRLFRVISSGCSVRNIAVTGCSDPGGDGFICNPSWRAYPAFSNCVFRNVYSSKNNYSFWVGEYVSKLFDCAYTNGTGEVTLGGYAYDCDFLNNSHLGYNIVSAYGCRFENNAVGNRVFMQFGGVLSNCVFKTNSSGNNTIASSKKDSSTEIIECEFEENSGTWICDFSNSPGKMNNAVVSGCTFRSNACSVVSMYDNSGVNPLNGTLTITNCWFLENTASYVDPSTTITSALKANVVVRGRVDNTNLCEVVGSTFSNNYYSVGYGFCNVVGVHAVGCSFVADAKSPKVDYSPDWRYPNEAADKSILEDCSISAGSLRDCIVNRCTIHDITNNVYSLFWDYARVSNSLVRCCGTASGCFLYSDLCGSMDAEFVNCTIVSNNFRTFELVPSRGNQNPVYPEIVGCRFVNSLFFDNRDVRASANNVSDITMAGTEECYNLFTGYVHFASSAYGVFNPGTWLSDATFAAKTNAPNTLAVCVNPCFVKDSRPDAPYWSLLPRSKLCGKGDTLDFTDSDLDLAGRLRLREGKIDPGCYQCWLNPAGFMMIVH